MEETSRQEFVRLRTELGMTQAELAAKLERSLGWVRRVEQGQLPCPMYAVYALRYLVSQAKRRKR